MKTPVKAFKWSTVLTLCFWAMTQWSFAALENYEKLSAKEIEDFVLIDPNGQPVQLSDFKGKVVVLTLWSVTCQPCLAEMPSLDRLAGALPDEEVVVIPLCIDQRVRSDKLKEFFAQQRYQYIESYLDVDGSVPRILGLKGTPTTYVINKEGKLIGRLEGATAWDDPKAIAMFEAIAQGKNVGPGTWVDTLKGWFSKKS
ncbi:MAG: TlpA family protein disulfide reductase [Holosporales bacterium]